MLQVSAQLVPFDAALQTLLSISGVLFATWFIIELKSIIIRCALFSMCVLVCTLTAVQVVCYWQAASCCKHTFTA